jgi:hypothetical protein
VRRQLDVPVPVVVPHAGQFDPPTAQRLRPLVHIELVHIKEVGGDPGTDR